MLENYWSRLSTERVRRRRALTITGSTALAAVLLAACGGGSDVKRDGSSLLTPLVDSTKQAKRGGVMKDRALQDPPTLDPFTANNPWNGVGPHMYSSLVQFKYGFQKPSENEVIGDIIEAWEWSPDGLQIALKLRPGIKWHAKAPVNGRALNMDDVVFSWERFSTKSSGRSGVVNTVNPQAPVTSLAATDSRTLLLKLTEPVVYALGLFASNSSGGMLLLPKETDSRFDIRGDMIGTGPFMMSNYTPSVAFTLKRHLEYYDKDYALVDTVEKPILTEYAAVLGQFKAGNMYHFGSHPSSGLARQEDIVPLKRELPQLAVYQGDLRIGGGGALGDLAFGWQPEGKSPFLDERVRQAISMSLDRDLYIEVFNNVSSFETEGLPVETRWNTAVGGSNEGWWLDPQGKDFGPNAKYFKHDLPEAKKLLAAAGYPSGFAVTSNYVPGGQLGDSYTKNVEVLDGFIRELGLAIKVNAIDYGTDYIPRYRDGKGQWEGWAYKTSAGGVSGGQPISNLANEFWSKSGAPSFHGFSTTGKNDLAGDPQVDALVEKGRLERDTEKLRAITFDLQRYLAKAWYKVNPPGIATTFTVAWPCVGNFRVFQGGNNWQNFRLWIDETKPPFKSA